MKLTISSKIVTTVCAIAIIQPAQAAETIPGIAEQPAAYFYTGKPYDFDLGTYGFAFRNYDPGINRWTSADPSGFPDGPNNSFYAPVPTSDFDYQGLLKWSTLQETGRDWTPIVSGAQATYKEYAIMANDGATSLNIYKYMGGAPTPLAADWRYNCAGYIFAGSGYWINPIASFGTPSMEAILRAEGYRQIMQPAENAIVLWGNDHIARVTQATPTGIVEEVTGKKGGSMNLTIGTLAEQWSGTPTYWE